MNVYGHFEKLISADPPVINNQMLIRTKKYVFLLTIQIVKVNYFHCKASNAYNSHIHNLEIEIWEI